MRTVQKGFTLIELMIVVAIVGILAAIALPAYQDYMVRAKMSEPMAKLDELKLSVAEFVASNNQIPGDSVEAGFGDASGGYVSAGSEQGTAKYYKGVAVDVANVNDDPPIIRVGVLLNDVANSSLGDVWIHMEGTVDSPGTSAVLWECRVDSADSSDADKATRYLPSSCRTEQAFTPS